MQVRKWFHKADVYAMVSVASIGSIFLGHCLTHIVQHTVREESSFEARLLLYPHFVREVKTTSPKSCRLSKPLGLEIIELDWTF